MLQWSGSAVSHATAVHVLLEIKEMPTGKRLALRTTHMLFDSNRRHECDPANSDEVITSDTAEMEPGGCRGVEQRRVQCVLWKGQRL